MVLSKVTPNLKDTEMLKKPEPPTRTKVPRPRPITLQRDMPCASCGEVMKCNTKATWLRPGVADVPGGLYHEKCAEAVLADISGGLQSASAE